MILFLEKGAILLAINKISNKNLDRFFLVVTDVGLGSFVAIVGVLFSLYKFRWSLLVLISLAWVGIFTNIFKRMLFSGQTRPFHRLMYDDFYRFIHDAPLIYFSSFPSGHTMTVFAFCSMLSYMLKRKMLGILFFVLAVVVGISRVYLLQHFFIDIYFGSILGIVSTLLAIWIVDGKLKDKKVLDKGVVQLIFKR